MARTTPHAMPPAAEHPQAAPAHFADRLAACVSRIGSFGCVGLDPVVERLPLALAPKNPADRALCADAIEAFSMRVLDAVADHIGIVKPQSACFERFGWEGVRALERVCHAAHERDMLVILDVKRGDIGVTAEHYAHGAFGVMRADAMTASAYMGADTLAPLTGWAQRAGEPGGPLASRGVFALVRTSNPGSDETQGALIAPRPGDAGEHATIADHLAAMIAREAKSSLGVSGWSSLGAVVAATKPADARRLRETMPHCPFLVPGWGAQGGDADSVRDLLTPANAGASGGAPGGGGGAFRGAVITASRSVLYPFKPDDANWPGAVKDAAARFAEELRAIP